MVLGAGFLGRGAVLTGVPSAHADTVTNVTVHYFRPAGDYGAISDTTSGWNLWMWPAAPASLGGAAYAFQAHDDFGVYAHVQVPGANTKVGIIVRLGNFVQKDTQADRFIDTPTQTAEVWLVQGDATIYYSEADAKAGIAQASQAHPINAFLDGTDWVALKMAHAIDLSAVHPSDLKVKDLETGAPIQVTAAADLASGGTSGQSDLLKVTLAGEPDVTHRLQIQYQSLLPIAVTPRLVLDDNRYFYSGNDLGASYAPSATTFKVWAPVASDVQLLTFTDDKGNGKQTVPMTKGANGVWSATVSGDRKGTYYLYRITNLGNTALALDPYAKALGLNAQYGMVADLSSTNPSGWSTDKYHTIKHQTDASIYEVHVRDFSIDPSSGITNRGKYLAFTEKGTKTPSGTPTGLDYLKKLGVNYVQLQPIEQITGLDDVQGATTALQPAGSANYNWGYETAQFQTPVGAYATNPAGTARVMEVKQMVQALHKAGIGVLLDMVFHSPSTSQFDPLVPGYYYRTDYTGTVEGGNGAGPDIEGDHRMVRKFMVDTVSYWMKEYHVDGFRFDWMSLLGHDTMASISSALRGIDSHSVILGEPWNNTGETLTGDTELTQGTQKGMHIGMFNDFIRDWLHGRVFTANQPGYATGDPSTAAITEFDANNNVSGFHLQDLPSNAITRETQFSGNITYSTNIRGWTQNPDEVINYVSSHDDQTLIDRIKGGQISGPLDAATQTKMDELMQGIVFTSQGVPFMQGGEEFLRTKGGDNNSYKGGDAENKFDWTLTNTNAGVVSYYSGIIHLRAAHSAFRMDDPALVSAHMVFLNSPDNASEFELTGHANKDKWKNILVIYNPYGTAKSFSLPKGKWNVVVKGGKAGTKIIGHATKHVSASAYTMEVLYQ
jgi:pullulanase